VNPRVLVCSTLALFLVVGRWNFGRLTGADDPSFVLEPRVWLVAVVAAIAFAPIVVPAADLTLRGRRVAVALLAFLGYHVVSSAWAPDFGMAATKGFELVLVAVVLGATIRLSSVLPPRALADGLWNALVVVFSIFAVFALLGSGDENSRLAVLGGGPNVFGRNMALLALFCTNALLRGRIRPIPVAGLAVAGMLVLLSGSRGAMLACATGTLVLLWVHRVRPSRLVWLAIIAIAAVAIVATFTDFGQAAMTMFRERVVRLTLEEEHDSGRSTLYDQAIALGMSAPIYGDGLAGFPARGLFVYPHNMVLEAFAEGGIVGVALLATALSFPLFAIVRRRTGRHALELAAFAALLASAQFSGDFYDSRGVLLFGLVAVLGESMRTASFALPPLAATRSAPHMIPVP
jgi:O-antigen ligase